jgi:hypothetical protein
MGTEAWTHLDQREHGCRDHPRLQGGATGSWEWDHSPSSVRRVTAVLPVR